MNNLEQLLHQLNLPQNDPRLGALAQFLQSEQGRALAQGVSAQTAARISQAVQAARRGDPSRRQANSAGDPPHARRRSAGRAAALHARSVRKDEALWPENDMLSALMNDPHALEQALSAASALLGGGAPNGGAPPPCRRRL